MTAGQLGTSRQVDGILTTGVEQGELEADKAASSSFGADLGLEDGHGGVEEALRSARDS